MRYAEVLSMAEWLAGCVIRLAQARHAQLQEERPESPASVAAVAGEVLRLVETRVGVELATDEERRG